MPDQRDLADTPLTQPDILYEAREGIAHVVFNRPHARNALTLAMYGRLAEICHLVNGDPDIKGMILTGAGDKAFAAGTDISEFLAFKTGDDAIAYEEGIETVLSALERCRVPTIAAISGACTGGGAAIACCCDLRIAATNAVFGYPVARTLGNCISLANYARFSDLVGAARVKDMIFRARLVDAQEALSIGLVTEVVAPDQLMQRADEMVTLVTSHAPLTLRVTKEALLRLRQGPSSDDLGRDLIQTCYGSDDFREGVDAFLNKRKPRWKGR